ncbi:glutathione S-transferase T3-like [Eutrema salsugineum]|uniref:glutathione S-transferase T3-like n=1 Tax=Eutrema salsugineum TaxID=72664 RepID=UPI000CED767A|nr:glutathione S-transferase T3-like [Eutrema salsugineum]
MDSYTDSGFMDLLNSQQHTQTLQPIENVSQNIGLGDSEASVFETDWFDGGSEAECVPKEAPKSRKKWSPPEYLILISAWLNTSKDPIVGNEQRADAFWKRISTYYCSSKKLGGMEKRLPIQCKQRWCKINESVCKFVGCYEAASAQKRSGQNENDVMKLANHIYLNDQKKKFTLEHAWRELRHDQKWLPKEANGGASKRRKADEASSHGGEEAPARPPGVKAAKAKGKRPVNRPVNTGEGQKSVMAMDFGTMCEMRRQDFALRDKLSRQKMLEGLLARADQLTDTEEAFKNQLIAEMM